MSGPTGGDVGLLQDLLRAEHAAVYGYGRLGARLEEPGRAQARLGSDAHRARRDLLTSLLLDRGATAPAAAPSYAVPVADRGAAVLLAVQLEQGLALRWRDLVAGAREPALRVLGATVLTEVAVRAARWRLLAGIDPATVALPGQG